MKAVRSAFRGMMGKSKRDDENRPDFGDGDDDNDRGYDSGHFDVVHESAKDRKVVSAWVSRVADWSACYGRAKTGSGYSVYKLEGQPQVFPEHKDSVDAWVPRWYGDQHCKPVERSGGSGEHASWVTSVADIGVGSGGDASGARRGGGGIIHETMSETALCSASDGTPLWRWGVARDYFNVEFALDQGICLQPVSVTVYETYFPGAVVAIHAKHQELGHWVCLWRGAPSYTFDPLNATTTQAREFSPALRGDLSSIDIPTRELRFEMDSYGAFYYPEIDAIRLTGHVVPATRLMCTTTSVSMSCPPRPLHLESPNGVAGAGGQPPATPNTRFELKNLPTRLLLHIMLDLPWATRLQTVSRVSRKWRDLAFTPYRISIIDLRPASLVVCERDITRILSNASSVPHTLSLAWCTRLVGCAGLDHVDVISALSNLRCLVLDGSAVDNSVFHVIAKRCPNLTSISLASLKQCCDVDRVSSTPAAFNIQNDDVQGACSFNRGLESLATGCPNIAAISLHHSPITAVGVQALATLTNLSDVDLSKCPFIKPDDVSLIIQSAGPKLRRLMLDKSGTRDSPAAHGTVMQLLGDICPNLQWLEIGWWRLSDGDGAVAGLIHCITNCTRLERLLMPCARTWSPLITDIIAARGRLTHLDVMGVSKFKFEDAETILRACTGMKMLDVFFSGCTLHDCDDLLDRFPHVDIKGMFHKGRALRGWQGVERAPTAPPIQQVDHERPPCILPEY